MYERSFFSSFHSQIVITQPQATYACYLYYQLPKTNTPSERKQRQQDQITSALSRYKD